MYDTFIKSKEITMRRKKYDFTITLEVPKHRSMEKVYMDKTTRPKKFKSVKDYTRKPKYKQKYYEEM